MDRPHGAGITAAPLTVGQGDRGHRRQKAQRQHLPDPGRQRQHPADGGGRQAESIAQQDHPQNIGPALLRDPRLQQQSDHQHRQKGVGLAEHPRHGVNRLRQAQAEQPQEQNGQKGVEGHGAEHSAQNRADRQALPAGEGGRQRIGAAAVEGAVARVKHGDGQQHVRRQKALHKGQDKGADIVAGGVEQVERPDGPRPPPGHQGGDSQQQDIGGCCRGENRQQGRNQPERAEAGEESPRQRQVDDDPGQQTGIALLKDAPSLEKVSQRHDQQQPAGFDE